MRNTYKNLTLFLLLILAYQAPAIVDPTKPPNTTTSIASTNKQVEQPTLQLEAIIKSPKGFQAMINKKIYSVGDKINGLSITKITAEAVFFSEGNAEFELTLTQPETSGIEIKKSITNQ
jgi:MSHA biogenesis protein MshK